MFLGMLGNQRKPMTHNSYSSKPLGKFELKGLIEQCNPMFLNGQSDDFNAIGGI